MKTWQHDELANDLAAHLVAEGRMIWTDIQLGPQGSPRPDVYTIQKSFVRPNPTAYECKISVSDFRSDVTTGKWSAYLNYAHAVVFSVPAGLVSKADVPEMCGLILRHENAWRIAKKPTINPRPIAEEALLKLLIDGVNREGPVRRAKWWNGADVHRKFAQRFGAEAARYVIDAAQAKEKIKQAEERSASILEVAEFQAKQIRDKALADMPARWVELLNVLGLAADANHWTVQRAIQEIRQAKGGSVEAQALRQVLASIQRTVNSHRAFLPEGL